MIERSEVHAKGFKSRCMARNAQALRGHPEN